MQKFTKGLIVSSHFLLARFRFIRLALFVGNSLACCQLKLFHL